MYTCSFASLFLAILVLVATENRPETAIAGQLTRVGETEELCVSPAIGLGPKSVDDPHLYPKWGPAFGTNCAGQVGALKLSVSHENMQNSHAGARNYNSNTIAYMADFDFAKDFGRSVRAGIRREKDTQVLSLGLDTIQFNEVNVITGWPFRYGHLFVALTDSTVAFSLDRDAVAEFDIRITESAVSHSTAPPYSGQRVMVGAVARWDEKPPRINTAHFLEADLIISEGYVRMYNEKMPPGCKDVDYDRCFYSENGRHAEGREISFRKVLHGPELARDPQQWTHVLLPVSATYRALTWVSKPDSWVLANVTGLYIGIESIGATNTELEIKNYSVHN